MRSELKESCHICRTSSIVTEVRMLRGKYAGQVFRLCDDCRDSDEVIEASDPETPAAARELLEEAERHAAEDLSDRVCYCGDPDCSRPFGHEEEAPEDPIAEPYYPGFNLDSEEWEDDRL